MVTGASPTAGTRISTIAIDTRGPRAPAFAHFKLQTTGTRTPRPSPHMSQNELSDTNRWTRLGAYTAVPQH